LQNYGAEDMVHKRYLFGSCNRKIGYDLVSTAQETHLQMDALSRAKCARIYQEKTSGAKTERPELMKLLNTARTGDVVIVWKLDRLAQSLRQLIKVQVADELEVSRHTLWQVLSLEKTK
jgi:hypothetical protein